MSCRDRTCGALDCDLCYPGNPWQLRREAKRREDAEDRADRELDRRDDERNDLADFNWDIHFWMAERNHAATDDLIRRLARCPNEDVP